MPASGEATPRTGVAFHVLRVAERSPAAEAGIDPFFDFICGVNGQPLVSLPLSLTDTAREADRVDNARRARILIRSPTCWSAVKVVRSSYKSTVPSARSYEVSLSMISALVVERARELTLYSPRRQVGAVKVMVLKCS